MAQETFTLAQVFSLQRKPTIDVMGLAGQVVHERARAVFGPPVTCRLTSYESWDDYLEGLIETGIPSEGIAHQREQWPAVGWAVGVIHEWEGTRTVFDDEHTGAQRLDRGPSDLH